MEQSEQLTNAWSTRSIDLINTIRIMCTEKIRIAMLSQSYGSLCDAHAEIGRFVLSLCLRPNMLNTEKEVLNEIETCLYGSSGMMETHLLCQKYQIRVSRASDGRKVIVNAPNLIGHLSKIFQDASIVAYNNNLIMPVPIERRLGTKRLEEVFES